LAGRNGTGTGRTADSKQRDCMAGSRFEYVKQFERVHDELLPNAWIVVRVDGNGFSEFVKTHGWVKPMDQRGVDLMVACAQGLMQKHRDVRMAFGQSDEFSFVLPRSCTLWKRRESKLVSSFSSFFAASFAMLWPKYFPETPLNLVPAFDARTIIFPTDANLRDYMSWRQADTHINHLLNCCYWALVDRKGVTPAEAQAAISGTNAGQKNELIFQASGTNYNDQPEQYRKGTFLCWKQKELQTVVRDIIKDDMWNECSWLLEN